MSLTRFSVQSGTRPTRVGLACHVLPGLPIKTIYEFSYEHQLFRVDAAGVVDDMTVGFCRPRHTVDPQTYVAPRCREDLLFHVRFFVLFFVLLLLLVLDKAWHGGVRTDHTRELSLLPLLSLNFDVDPSIIPTFQPAQKTRPLT